MTKALVVYDSVYGNTEQIANAIGAAIGEALGDPAGVAMLRVSEATPDKLTGVDLLVVGAPTHRFRPTPATSELLKGLPNKSLEGVKVAAFDTRLTQAQINEIKVLGFFVNIFGYAADPIAKLLVKKGGELAVPGEGFYVADSEGPLVEEELQRAAEWVSKMVTGV